MHKQEGPSTVTTIPLNYLFHIGKISYLAKVVISKIVIKAISVVRRVDL